MPLSDTATVALKRLEASSLPLRQQELRRTIEYAARLYGDARHWTGLTFLEHALGVLQVLLPFRPDADTVNACILQHAIETKNASIAELEEEFGARVRQFVSGVHLLSHVSTRLQRGSIEELRLMLLSVADDIRVLLIVLSKRCFALERAEHVAPADRKRVARDALWLFAPVAARLGIHSFKQRLESLAFPIVYPADAERIAEQLAQVHARHGEFLEPAAEALRHALAEQGVEASVQGREKQAFSIFSKMRTKNLTHVESLPDLFALRVVVESEEECYRALGILHRISRPLPNRFKDYISFPKPNGYRSLHTTLARLPSVPEGLFVEVQVRTQQMHREAEYGIAAHWSYKEGGSAEQSLQRVAMQQALASQHAMENDAARMPPRLADHIFVLTPKGDIVELPEGATTLDFAFQIHTDVGLSFRAARVNGSIVPLDYELENGDMVEILLHKIPKPSTEWLQLLRMASSRSRLKRYLHTQHRDRDVIRGKGMVNAGPIRAVRAEPKAAPAGIVRLQRKDSLVELEGNVPMPMKFAKCCKPQEGDRAKLLGIITRGGDVMIHAATCRNALRGNPERRIVAKWRKGV